MVTGSDERAGTRGQVMVVLCGEYGDSKALPLEFDSDKQYSKPGSTERFEVREICHPCIEY